MPGVTKGDLSDRNLQPQARTKSLTCAPTGRAWAAATTEGVVIYSLDHTLLFDPLDLDVDVTPENIMIALRNREYLKALVMSFRLNEKEIISKVLEGIPASEIRFVAYNFPLVYIKRLLDFLGVSMEWTRHLEHHQLWISHLFTGHGQYIKDNASSLSTQLRSILKSTSKWFKDMAKLTEDNLYTLDYFCTCPTVLDTETLKDGESPNIKSELTANWETMDQFAHASAIAWHDEDDENNNNMADNIDSDEEGLLFTTAKNTLLNKNKDNNNSNIQNDNTTNEDNNNNAIHSKNRDNKHFPTTTEEQQIPTPLSKGTKRSKGAPKAKTQGKFAKKQKKTPK